MREIEFKYFLYHKDNENDIVKRVLTLDEIQENDIEWIYEQFEKEHSISCNCFNESCNHCECDPLFENHVIKYICEYTGLRDRNKEKIYEGDIIRGSIVMQVIFKNGCFFAKPIKHTGDRLYFLYRINKMCEVIGNIHENKELLK